VAAADGLVDAHSTWPVSPVSVIALAPLTLMRQSPALMPAASLVTRPEGWK
jgi:hypothetical protein